MFAKNKKWFFLFILSLVWGSSFILIKKSLIGLTALQLGALRIIISGLFIFLIGSHKLKSLSRTDWKWIMVTGVVGTFLPAFLFAFAISEIDSSVASILNSLTPLNTILLGFFLFSISSTRRQITGVIIGFIGTSILIGAGINLNPDQNYLYALFIILATFLYATNINIIKHYLQDVSALAIATGNFATVIIPAFLVLIFTGFFKVEVLTNPDLKMAMIYIVILSVFGTALAKVMFNKMVQISTPVFASSVTYLIPIVALAWGIIDGESFSFKQGLGSALILFGVYLSNRKR
ncbi:MAG: DMT family transporter [Flavobacteriaceae bacterium]|nr:DMT family transporter [Bacteroidia bacterium]NNK83121.1 DMT family transporter [Flavobacteriaceae bacterium]